MRNSDSHSRNILLITYSLLFIAVIPKVIWHTTISYQDQSEFSLVNFFSTNTLTNSMRYGAVLMGIAIEWIITGIGDALSIVRDSVQNPDTYVPPQSSVPNLNNMLTSIVYRFIVIFPLYIIATRWIRPTAAAVVFLLFMFASIGGYGAANNFMARTLYFSLFPDMHWYFFDLREGTYYVDFIAIGFLPCLALVLERGTERLWPLLLLTVLGQICYEHFGFVSGVAGAFFILLHGPGLEFSVRFRRAFRILAFAGILTIATIAVLLLPGVLAKGSLVFVGGRGEGWAGFIAEAASNRANWKHVIVRMAYMVAPACAAGVIVGALSAFFSPIIPISIVRVRFHALLAVLIAFSASVMIGFIALTNFSSEMGRELLQIISIIFLFFFYAAYLMVAKMRKN